MTRWSLQGSEYGAKMMAPCGADEGLMTERARPAPRPTIPASQPTFDRHDRQTFRSFSGPFQFSSVSWRSCHSKTWCRLDQSPARWRDEGMPQIDTPLVSAGSRVSPVWFRTHRFRRHLMAAARTGARLGTEADLSARINLQSDPAHCHHRQGKPIVRQHVWNVSRRAWCDDLYRC